MFRMTKMFTATAFAAIVLAGASGAQAALFCHNDGSRFNEWKAAVKQQYRGQFKASTLAKLDRVSYSTQVIKLDRANRKSFKGGFDAFYKRRAQGVAPIARKKIRQYQQYFDLAEQRFGVQPEVIAAIWGLETAFGSYKGRPLPILQSVATLAYDCRRSESLFFPQLIAALTVIDRGLIDLEKAKGAWAGEIGQTQMLSSHFLSAATDFDGGGVNVFSSAPDVIGTTAKWFAINGWQRGGDYSEGSANYNVIKKWNKATLYQKTIAKLGKEIRG